MLRSRCFRGAFVLATGALAGLPACSGKVASPDVPAVADPRLQSVLTSIAGQMQRCSIPGGAIAIVENGQLTESVGFGVEDPGGAAVSATTRFQTAGLSKVLLGAAALSLVEKGKLDLAQPVTRYAPLTLAAGFDPSSVTVQQLLTHTSGLPDLDTDDLSCPVGAGQLAAWFAAQPPQPLWAPPGSVWDYSQRGYSAAAWAIEGATSGRFEDAVAQLVLGPAGMTTATFEPADVLAGDYALGHALDSEGHPRATYAPGQYDCEAFRAADGVYAGVDDFAQLAVTLYAGGGAMLQPASVKALETGQVADLLYPGDEYTYGMYAHSGYRGLDLLRTSGSLHGFRSSFWMVPDSSFAVVVFFDADNPSSGCSTEDAAAVAVTTFLGLDDVPAPDWSTPPSTWAEYAGTYFDPFELGTITVAFDGTNLTASTAVAGPITLQQQSATAFEANFPSGTETVTFAPGASGPAGWFVTRLGVGRRQ
jgi:CubicO group peptidase (beta-lactamase class C family)